MNRYLPHVYIIPEDDRDRQLADGFIFYDQVNALRVQVMPPPGGWARVLNTFKDEYIRRLRGDLMGHVVMLIDFDGDYTNRRKEFEDAIPDDLKNRVFVVGSKETPELLKRAMAKNYEQIGAMLAEDCFDNTVHNWNHDHLIHNEPDRRQLVDIVKPILFA